jgi:sulfur carrier protein ThiS
MTNNIIAQVMGGAKQILDGVNTVADVKTRMNAQGYTALVNGSPADDSYALSEGDIVTLSKAVKGGY